MSVISGTEVQVVGLGRSWELLRAQRVGRLAFSDRALPTIRPLNYTVVGSHLVLRVGVDLARRLEGQVVAFEVDDIVDGQASGTSVVVTATARRLVGATAVLSAAHLPPSWAGVDHQNIVFLAIGDIQGRRLAPRPAGLLGHQIRQLAGRAPSVHNTQPWDVSTTETNDGVWVRVCAVPARQLPVLDPDGRQLAISCGAALDHAIVAAEGLGLRVSCGMRPAEDYPELARLSCSKGAASPEQARLLEAIGRRRTYRGRFTSRRVTHEVRQELTALAEGFGCWLRVVSPDEEVALAVLLSKADAAEQRDPAYLKELEVWSDAPTGSGFGVPETSRDPSHGDGSSFALRDFGATSPSTADDPPAADHPLLMVLGTDGDERLDWLACGRALSRLLLTATDEGLAAQPLGQVTDGVGWRSRLVAQLGLVGHAQVVLRFGYPSHDLDRTPRITD